MPKLSRGQKRAKVANLVTMIGRLANSAEIKKVLVVGAGDGLEAEVISGEFSAQTIAIDLNPRFELGHRDKLDFRAMDARDMDFADCEFDPVYS